MKIIKPFLVIALSWILFANTETYAQQSSNKPNSNIAKCLDNIKRLEPLVNRGSRRAKFEMSVELMCSKNSHVDSKKGLSLLLELANDSELGAIEALAHIYDTGYGGIQENSEKAYYWYNIALALIRLNPQDLFEHSFDDEHRFVNRRQIQQHRIQNIKLESIQTQGLEWWRKNAADHFKKGFFAVRSQAEAGEVRFQNRIADMFWRGEGVPQHYINSIRWYRIAAENKDDEAKFRLGYAYSVGMGIRKSQSSAFEWYFESAKDGNSKAQFAVSENFMNGQGVDANRAQALKWFNSGVENNLRSALDLAILYSKSLNDIRKLIDAKKWVLLVSGKIQKLRANPSNYLKSKHMISRMNIILDSKLTSMQIEQAKKDVLQYTN